MGRKRVEGSIPEARGKAWINLVVVQVPWEGEVTTKQCHLNGGTQALG